MTELSPEALNRLSREELIALIVQLFAEVRQLRAEVERLKKPPTTSQNSSQPPSRDQKSNLPAKRRHRRRGAKPGHAKAERPLSDHPDQVIEARVTQYSLLVDTFRRIDSMLNLASVKASLIISSNVLVIGVAPSAFSSLSSNNADLHTRSTLISLITLVVAFSVVSAIASLVVVFSFLESGEVKGEYTSLIYFGSAPPPYSAIRTSIDRCLNFSFNVI